MASVVKLFNYSNLKQTIGMYFQMAEKDTFYGRTLFGLFLMIVQTSLYITEINLWTYGGSQYNETSFIIMTSRLGVK